MGSSKFSEMPKSIIDGFKAKTQSTNYSAIVSNCHFWTDLNQLIHMLDVGYKPTQEELIIGLKNSLKYGYELNQSIKEKQINEGFTTILQMIEYIQDENYSQGIFYTTLCQTIQCGYNLATKLKSNRQEIFDRIDGERKYQDENWGVRRSANGTPDEEKPISEWINYIEYHLSKAKERVYHLDDDGALHEIRKVTALGVRTMEIHGCPERIIKLNYNPDKCCGNTLQLRDGCCGVCENNE